MKIPLIFFKNKQPWQWPSCKHPRTLSFRATANDVDHVFKTVNSVFIDTPKSYRFTNSLSSDDDSSSSLEMIVRGVRMSGSERLFVEPGYTTSSIVKGEIMPSNITIDDGTMGYMSNGSVAVVAMESDDPCLDFKKSMTEMVENHGLMKDWDCLEELLGWYLRMNSSNNHAFIVTAFLDLLVTNSSSASSIAVCCSDSTSYSSANSCFSSPSSSPFSHDHSFYTRTN